ncbi:MAG: hypothetical protein HC927_09915 [Deltaproteobacteria bacterium]|nr:hypothetical protein [Deltaproteobacteria bacterium]
MAPSPAKTAFLTAGGNHSCAVRSDGRLRCWGRNDRGELGLGPEGLGNIGDDETPAQVTLEPFPSR